MLYLNDSISNYTCRPKCGNISVLPHIIPVINENPSQKYSKEYD